MKGRVLICAGSDSGGGAGIQADIKAVTALDGFAMTAITALTAQNTHGVQDVMGVPVDFVKLQISMVLTDLGADAIKTGMLADVATINAVFDALAEHGAGIPVVVDPVMIAKGGHPLLAQEAVETLRRRAMPVAALLTPNIPEAEAMTGRTILDLEGMRAAGRKLVAEGAQAVMVKGGHLDGPVVHDLLVTADGEEVFEGSRIDSRHTHGTGCTLASAIAAGLAQGRGLPESVRRGRAYLRLAMLAAPGYGGGHGPLNHAVTLDQAILDSLG
ncbi:bifunctional hydroxymethylpyrimidine kinase/phosphomethylpyrimidine kinase [Acetobacteraceae bacterium H6797]|nr:bifunctional hydroxymethylpyrimidine kinase/phosphomethylpyrimidine kinase [Acetobacteraceae bacterium H6797]